MITNTEVQQMVERYLSSSNTDIKGDFTKITEWLKQHKQDYSLQDWSGWMMSVSLNYLNLLMDKGWSLKQYCPTDEYRIVGHFKDKFRNGEIDNIDLMSIIPTMEPNTFVNVLYWYNKTSKKVEALKQKYLSKPNNSYEIDITSYIEKLTKCNTIEELFDCWRVTKDEFKRQYDGADNAKEVWYKLKYAFEGIRNSLERDIKGYKTSELSMQEIIDIYFRRIINGNDSDASTCMDVLAELIEVLMYRTDSGRLSFSEIKFYTLQLQEIVTSIIEAGETPKDAILFWTNKQTLQNSTDESEKVSISAGNGHSRHFL